MEAAQIVLSRGEEDGLRADRRSIGERGGPGVGAWDERFDGCTAQDAASSSPGVLEQSLIENATGERQSLKRELFSDDPAARGEAESADGFRAEIARIDAELMEIVHGLTAEELAADFVVCGSLTLDQYDFPSGAGETNGGHGAGGTAAYDEVIGS